MDWLKKKWEFAAPVAVVLCGILRVFGPERLATWSGWTAVVFMVLVVGGVFYDRSAALQALVGKVKNVAGAETHNGDERPLGFRGLLPFREEDAAEFVKLGRQNDVAALLPALRDPGLRVVVLRGESGCGKTSLIRAGLLPILAAQGWKVVSIDPETENPSDLIRNAQATAPASHLLIVADQFEERFVRGEPKAVETLRDTLRQSIERNEGKWLIGVRSDFKYVVDDLVERYRGDFEAEFLRPRVGYGLRLFTIGEAENVISEVGKQIFDAGVGLQFAEDLSRGGRVLPADVQFVGFEMQQRGIRTLDGYRKAGGRDGIIADSIRSVIEQFPSEDRRGNSRKLLISLIDQEHGTRLPEALTAEELSARAGIDGSADIYCEPFVKQRLILRVSDRTNKGIARYRLAHDYLVQPIYTAIGHTETNYEKVIRLLTLYAAEYGRNPQARIPRYDYRLIRRLVKKVSKDSNLNDARRLAAPIIRSTRRRFRAQRGIVAGIGIGLVLFLPPIRFEIESKVTRQLNSRMLAKQPEGEPRVIRYSNQNVVGEGASLFQYGRMPFLRRIPIPEVVMCPLTVANDKERDSKANSGAPASFLAVGRFHITVAQFNAYASLSGRREEPGDPDMPVVGISWDDANSYCGWLSQVTGRRFRLPSEAEWENVCRGGKSDTPGSGALGEYAWNFENTTDGKRQLVGRKRPNSLGLYDMLGNVEQWVAGWDENWASRSTRGGNWTDKASELSCSNSADRSARDASEVVGFRVVADPH